MPSADPPFSAVEWAACLKVLEAVADDPDAAPDLERIGRLVARINRQTRRGRREASAAVRSEADRALIEATGRVRAAPRLDQPAPATLAPGEMLQARSRRCYICKERYRAVHAHYHQLCPRCADFNHAKRLQRADLMGRWALVTGGRIKIGYATALKLLRDGASVVVTTRFPTEAASRYSREPDFLTWRDRLRVEPLDFRSIPAVLAFTERLLAELPALDILINNAAQTVRRPPEYDAPARAIEGIARADLPANIRPLLGVQALRGGSSGGSPAALEPIPPPLIPWSEPIDDREANSWTARLDDVGAVEVLEVMLINATTPYLLIGQLKPLLARSPFGDRYIINVAGLDGQFNRPLKTDRHPHVNMSKAALNMITRTSASDYAQAGIFMNSVDAGWVTHEVGYSARVRQRTRGFVPPLDEQDAASRIYDPIVQGLGGHRPFGQFFKDYQPTDW